MKKLMLLIVVVISTMTAFAQGDAMKEIMKAKDYEQAEQLLKSNLQSLSNEDKAKAYNKLVDMAMAKFSKEETTLSTNQMLAQLGDKAVGQGKIEPFDTLGLYTAVYRAMKSGIECDKYDKLPNEKGKVKPRFHKPNSDRLYPIRPMLINGGQEFATKNDEKSALDFYGLYVESGSDPLFDDADKSKKDEYIGEVARVAAVLAFQQNHDIEKANQYCDVALKDSAVHDDALSLKVYLLQQGLKTREDSVQYANKLRGLYGQYPNNEQIFSTLANLYGGLGMNDEQSKLVDDEIQRNPNGFYGWAFKGQNEVNNKQWDAAIADLKKALAIDPKSSVALTYIGFSLNAKAAESTDAATQKSLLQESMGYLEKARDVDPDCQQARWTYPLYQCYYALFGESDSRTQQLQKLVQGN